MATIDGTSNAETLTGTSGDDLINGMGGNDTLQGLGGHDRLDGGAGADAMEGGSGNDVYIVDDYGDSVVENVGGGADRIETALVHYTLPAHVEDLTLTGVTGLTRSANGNGLDNVIAGAVDQSNEIYGHDGHDTLHGGAWDDLLDGGSGNDIIHGDGGNDILFGGEGLDTLIGGAGDEIYTIFGDEEDVIVEAEGGGYDRVRAFNDYTLTAWTEMLALFGTAVRGTGNALQNVIYGNDLDNLLDGGGGADSLWGGQGNDTYVVTAGDVVVEYAGEGIDTIESAGERALGDHIENLTLTGSANIDGSGNDLANVIIGNAGRNTLWGRGGADTLIGGKGNDTYRIDQSDTIVEDADGGIDSVIVAGFPAYTLQANFERLIVTNGTGYGNELDNYLGGDPTGGSSTITLYGEGGNDTLFAEHAHATLHGGTGNDKLTGGQWNDTLSGDEGADQMAGGLGDDVYYVDDAGDTVEEAQQLDQFRFRGDVVYSSISWAMSANVEILYLTDGALNGTGNALGNAIYGNANDNLIDGGAGADWLSGGLGNDTFIVDNAGDEIVGGAEDDGDDIVLSSVSFSLAGTWAETLTLTGSASINATGSSGADTLNGNSGDNVLNGGQDADVMNGGAGNDRYQVGQAGDVVNEEAGEGTDEVVSTIDYVLGANVENLILIGDKAIDGTGNGLANTILGNGADNVLTGGAGDDLLQGRGGADALIGGEGYDEVSYDRAAAGVTLNLRTGVHSGEAAGDTFSGIEEYRLSNFDDSFTGTDANEVIFGGEGTDAMAGRGGNDFYHVDDAGDTVRESAGEGTDTVESSVSFSLAGQYVEYLRLSGTADIRGTGNSLDNRILGNTGANLINGAAGADWMEGREGNDRYIVDNAGDIVIEKEGEGIDRVDTSVGFSLAGQYIENLVLTGNAAINGTGNGLANTIQGNAAGNIIDGGAGADRMEGGLGNDRYIVDEAGDRVFEAANGGSDTVDAWVSFSLAGQYVETLRLMGSGDINGSGNNQANSITGNTGANELFGAGGDDRLNGGLGSDNLTGGSGADRFVFASALGGGNVDDILDFSVADDSIYLDRSVFAVNSGMLKADAFTGGTAAADANDRIIHDSASGNIWYDADGTGAGEAILFATVTAGTMLTAADFIGF